MDYVRTDISEPLEEPVSLDEAKSWCRVDHHHEDDLIEGLVAAARAYCEGHTGATLTPNREAVAYFERWPDAPFRLRHGPVQGVTEVAIWPEGGPGYVAVTNETKLLRPGTSATLSVEGDQPELGDVAEPVRIKYLVGRGCPAPVKMAIKLLVGHWYEHREEETNAPTGRLKIGVEALLSRYATPRY